MPRGSGIYEDEPRDERGTRPQEADASKSEQAPDDTSAEHSQEPPD